MANRSMAQYALVQSRWLGDSINLSGPRLNGLQDSTPTELFNHTNMADQPPADTPATEPAAEEAPAGLRAFLICVYLLKLAFNI